MLKPLNAQLTILQQEGYSLWRFLRWWITHPFSYFISSKKPLVITKKVKTLLKLSYVTLITLILLSLYSSYYLIAPIIILIFLLEPYIFLLISLIFLAPYEKINRRYTISRIRQTILNHPDLTVVGITGSFGKTSVKDFLFTILSGWKETLKTPESYNTIFGIAKVIDYELLSKTQIFLCEMGAYVRGEIAELCHMIPPNYAILTAIGSQHLERFKNVGNTTLAKFELIDAVAPQNALANLDNIHIAGKLSFPEYSQVKTYSLMNPAADFYVMEYSMDKDGLTFTLVHQDKKYYFNSSLFGTSNLYNLTAAISMALLLKVPKNIIREKVGEITPTPHRLELKKMGKATLIDNAFSSNEDGFTTLISDLSKLRGKKVLITPGIVELGVKTVEVHKRLGELSSDVFDEVILVGKSLRTLSLEKGLTSSPLISYIPNSQNLWPLIQKLSEKYDWILLENDLPDAF